MVCMQVLPSVHDGTLIGIILTLLTLVGFLVRQLIKYHEDTKTLLKDNAAAYVDLATGTRDAMKDLKVSVDATNATAVSSVRAIEKVSTALDGIKDSITQTIIAATRPYLFKDL